MADSTLSVGGVTLSLSANGEGMVTIPTGKSSVAIRLAVAPDALLEWDETVRISLLPASAGSTHSCIGLASADATILDDALLGGLRSRTVDPASTGLTAATVGHGAAAINFASSEATVALPLVLGSFASQDMSNDTLRPIVALETPAAARPARAGGGNSPATLAKPTAVPPPPCRPRAWPRHGRDSCSATEADPDGPSPFRPRPFAPGKA